VSRCHKVAVRDDHALYCLTNRVIRDVNGLGPCFCGRGRVKFKRHALGLRWGGEEQCLTMLDVSRAMFEEPDVIFRVDNREREAWGYPASMANNNGWGHAPLSHSMRCRAVWLYPPSSLPRLMPPTETYSRSQRLARLGQSSLFDSRNTTEVCHPLPSPNPTHSQTCANQNLWPPITTHGQSTHTAQNGLPPGQRALLAHPTRRRVQRSLSRDSRAPEIRDTLAQSNVTSRGGNSGNRRGADDNSQYTWARRSCSCSSVSQRHDRTAVGSRLLGKGT